MWGDRYSSRPSKGADGATHARAPRSLRGASLPAPAPADTAATSILERRLDRVDPLRGVGCSDRNSRGVMLAL